MSAQSHEDLIANILSRKRVVDDEPKRSHHHGGKPRTSHASKREATYRGRKIKIRTTYRIEIDDEVLTIPFTVDNEGRVHCHGLPNYAASSALDLVRRLIDTTPRRRPKNEVGELLARHVREHA